MSDPLELSERQFQAQVVEYARLLGWWPYSIPDSRRATSRGFPDLTLMHPGRGRLAFAELKDRDGRVSAEQSEWLILLAQVAEWANRGAGKQVVGVFVWRPGDWDAIQLYLDGRDWPSSREAA